MNTYIISNLPLLILFFLLILFIFCLFFKHSTSSILEHSAFYCISLSLQLSLFYCVAVTQRLSLEIILYVTTFYLIFVFSNIFINKKKVTKIRRIKAVHVYSLLMFVFIQMIMIVFLWMISGIPAIEMAKGGVYKLHYFKENRVGQLLDLFLTSSSSFISFAIFLIYFEKRNNGEKSNRLLFLLIPSLLFFLGGYSKSPLLFVLFSLGLAIKKTNSRKVNSILVYILPVLFIITLLFKFSIEYSHELIGSILIRLFAEGDLYYYLFAIDSSQLDQLKVGNIFGNTITYSVLWRMGYNKPSYSIGEQLINNLFGVNYFGPNSLAPIWGYVAGGYFGGILYAFILSILHVFIARTFIRSSDLYRSLFFGFLYMNFFTLFRDSSLFFYGPWRYIWIIMIIFYIFSKFFLVFRKRKNRFENENDTVVW